MRDRNYFELFALPVSYEIDQALLSVRYQELQRTTHPDRFTHATDRERRLSMQQASMINEAYQTLKDPLKRAQYLLDLQGIDVTSESNTVMDTQFLMQQMTLREALDDIMTADEPLTALDAFMADIESQISDIDQSLRTCFSTATEESLSQAAGLSLQLQFLSRLREEAEDREEALL